jgi:hypothetical protein
MLAETVTSSGLPEVLSPTKRLRSNRVTYWGPFSGMTSAGLYQTDLPLIAITGGVQKPAKASLPCNSSNFAHPCVERRSHDSETAPKGLICVFAELAWRLPKVHCRRER